MSVSGVRTVYDEEVGAIAKLIGAKLRRREDSDTADADKQSEEKGHG